MEFVILTLSALCEGEGSPVTDAPELVSGILAAHQTLQVAERL